MYNHYQGGFDYLPVDAGPAPRASAAQNSVFCGAKETSGGIRSFLSGITDLLHIDHFDSGDILLILILLFLLREGDDLELIITLGLILLLGLGES